MDVRVGDILVMRKTHPCGSNRFQVTRIGADFKIKCLGCSHEIMLTRVKCEKGIKQIERKEEN